MFHPRTRVMLAFALPAIIIGVMSSLVLVFVMMISGALQNLLWENIPAVLNINTQSASWTLFMLTLTGIGVGAIIKYMPGHAGPDPATESLIGAPVAVSALPGLALALMVGLAGGVSLGPEHPITVINIALVAAIGSRLLPAVPTTDWVILAAAGTIGALFGTPVAAALIFSQTLGTSKDVQLWDRLFAPLLAAGAGAITTDQFFQPDFSLSIPSYDAASLMDIFSGSVVVLIAIALGMIAVWLFPHVHRMFNNIQNPVLRLGIGGFVLGLLALTGGEITLFKGLDEMKELAHSNALFEMGPLLAITLTKLAALVVAAACGFRGGRIFPAVFVGVSLGLMLHQYAPDVPAAVTVSCAVMGMVLVVTRDGWLSLFMAAAVVPGLKLLPLLCIVMLPAWLMLAGKPLMQVAKQRLNRPVPEED
ncbi:MULTISPECIES: ion channel protein [Rahnella]|jgi:H+/Cl- antiporter ClcA|uniref:Putative ion-transport protein Rahaq_1129 n=1 Tax=Rahnella sp. (strain Y9602) TaxID=2703885 RepID=A0A0H3FCN1_RAHSY|nr:MULTISPECIES: ion channel protein [Rahnella]AFE57338.1 putative ion channel protein [Rahnella aquatilis HX2]AYA06095.1 ion channel protein [Rahnella aquatilis]ADW72752.1 Cl- channel voltage-gated family protein [Rahnella aceris]AZP41332.1 ion channel protein [Rahnella aquatilis]AZP45673.1 ion channel protein [Rahnella aquatilis]